MEEKFIKPIRYIEQWKEIDDSVIPNVLPGYFVSTFGRIYTMQRSRKFLVQVPDKNGYLNVCIHLKIPHSENCVRNQISVGVSRIVKMAFEPIENPELYEVHHMDNNTFNNSLENLLWVTPEEHKVFSLYNRTYDQSIGMNNPMSILTNDQVFEIVNLYKNNNYTYKQLADLYNVSSSTISEIIKGNSWTHLDLGLDFNNDRRYSNIFANNDIHNICKFYESHDINNKLLYPSVNSIIRDCYYSLGLDLIYGEDVENHRKYLTQLLYKNKSRAAYIYNQYNYNYIR